jgi:hypothetical protein
LADHDCRTVFSARESFAAESANVLIWLAGVIALRRNVDAMNAAGKVISITNEANRFTIVRNAATKCVSHKSKSCGEFAPGTR